MRCRGDPQNVRNLIISERNRKWDSKPYSASADGVLKRIL